MSVKTYVFDEIRQVIKAKESKGVFIYGKKADGAFFGPVKTGCYIKCKTHLYLVDGNELKPVTSIVEGEKVKKQQWQNRIDELEKELAELKANPPQSEHREQWQPCYKEKYWFVGESGELLWQLWNNENYEIDLFESFNVFETEEEAEFARERMKVMRELDLWSVDNTGEVSKKYYFYHDNIDDVVKVGIIIGVVNTVHAFETREIAEQAFEEIGEDRLKKYYFRVV